MAMLGVKLCCFRICLDTAADYARWVERSFPEGGVTLAPQAPAPTYPVPGGIL